jgi:PKD repeat protein
MKRLFILIFIVPLIFTACKREPVADFIASATQVGVGENIIFTNRSLDAKDFEWDFGDGYISYNYNVTHFYEEPGNYQVKLKAFGKDGVSIATLNITVLQTYLEITVEEYYEPFYLVSDVRVRLYPTVQDWENQTNLVVQGFTNNQGVITFSGLFPKRYYVDVYGDYHDNYELAADDVAWIETHVLIPGELNLFTAVVDYYPPGARKSDNSLNLKQSKKVSIKLSEPRKVSERSKSN